MGEVFLKLLNMSLSASFLIAAVILLRLVLKKAPKWTRGILWALVAVRLLCPFSLESKLSLMPDVDVDDLAYASMERGEQTALEEIGGADGPAVTFETAIPVVVTPNLPDDFQPSEPAEGFSLTLTGADIVAAVWLAGVLVMLLYALISYLRLRRRVAAALAEGEGVWLCDAVESPFILGLFRPCIYLPSGISGKDTAYILAHERAHLARRDHWWKPLGFLLLAVYWFNPLVWVAYVLLCRDIELACDEKVVQKLGEGEKKAYSEALLSCSLPRKMISACPLAFGEVGVKARIKSVLNYKKPTFWIILVAVIACLTAAVCFLTDPVTKSEDQPGAVGEWENVQVTLELDQAVDSEAVAIAREYVQNIVYQQNDIYDPDNTLVNAYYYTAAKVTGLEQISTGTAAENHSINLYKLEYRLLPSDLSKVVLAGGMEEEDGWITENGSMGAPYLVILADSRSGETVWSLIGKTTTGEIMGKYSAAEMLEQYGNAYTAAAMEIFTLNQGAKTLEEAVHQAILDYHAPQQPDDLFYCESHKTLKTEERTAIHPVTGDESRIFTVYTVVYHAGYSSAIRDETGSHIPTAITFMQGDDGTYELLEFWLPRDGSYYADDIREKFPAHAAIAALNLQQYVEESRANCDAQAAQYFGANEPEGMVQKISETVNFTEWKGYTAVLTAATTLKDPYSVLLHSTRQGSDWVTSYEWIDLDTERELRKGDILMVIGEENGKRRVTVPYGDLPWIYGWVDSSLLSTNQRNIQTGNQAILRECPVYDEAGGNQLGEESGRVQILSLGREWAWVEEYGTGAEPYWVKTEDLSFDFHSETVLDRPE